MQQYQIHTYVKTSFHKYSSVLAISYLSGLAFLAIQRLRQKGSDTCGQVRVLQCGLGSLFSVLSVPAASPSQASRDDLSFPTVVVEIIMIQFRAHLSLVTITGFRV